MSDDNPVSEQERSEVYEYLDMVASSHARMKIEEIADGLLLQFGLTSSQARMIYSDWKRARSEADHA